MKTRCMLCKISGIDFNAVYCKACEHKKIPLVYDRGKIIGRVCKNCAWKGGDGFAITAIEIHDEEFHKPLEIV